MHRTFTFSSSNDNGISNEKVEAISEAQEARTIVSLLGYEQEYAKNNPLNSDVIAQRIVEHCLEYFTLGNMPNINLNDPDEGKSIDLDGIYLNLMDKTQADRIEIKGNKFDVIHFLLNAHADLGHKINYCGNHRVVLSENIEKRIPNLSSTLSKPDSDGSFVYSAYVMSEYLDLHVNQTRTGFDLFGEDGTLYSNEIKWDDIEGEVLSLSKNFLSPYTEELKKKKEERILDYVTEEAPQFRPLVKHFPNELDGIDPDVRDDELDTKLYEIQRKVESELSDKGNELLNEKEFSEDGGLSEEYLDKFSKWWEEYNDLGKAALAKYVTHRKRVLEILEDALRLKDTGKYSREEIIHRIIFPLRSTSDDIAYSDHNLWIIDEKLAYHEYLASDIPLRNI